MWRDFDWNAMSQTSLRNSPFVAQVTKDQEENAIATLYGRIGKQSGGAMPFAGSPSRDTLQDYISKLVAMIPTEVVGIYFVGKSIAPRSAIITLGLWGLLCWLLVFPFRVLGAKGPGKYINLAIALIAFPIWVFAIGGTILDFDIDEATSSLLVILVGGLGAFLYNNDPPGNSSGSDAGSERDR